MDQAQLAQAFEEFKSHHNGQLNDLQQRLDEVESRSSRASIFGGQTTGDLKNELHKLGQWMRTEIRDEMSVGDESAGGMLVSPALEAAIGSVLFTSNPMRELSRIAMLRPGDGDAHEELIKTERGGANWVGETETRGETDQPTTARIRVPLHELQAEPHVTQKLLDMASFNVESFLTEDIGEAFRDAEEAAFTSANGVGQPRGVLDYPNSTDDDDTRAFGTVQYVATGDASGFAASNPGDALQDVVTALSAPYRGNAAWQMNSNTEGEVRKFKDSDGHYLWSDSFAAGQPATLLGFPVRINEDLPDIAADAFPIMFGDWSRGYRVVDLGQTRLLRDPYTTKGYVKFYATRRVGGGLRDSRAVKLLKIEA